ncbi:MAG: Zn-ribbon domain-containing OB-fold protein [Candidatus Thorarchaeota archaeon]|nr:Zn-ribbon domain-containing OB-fold protein [Candidatus Thorarchaeota archaeon]
MSEKPSVEQYLQNIQEGQFKAYKCVDCGMVIAPPSGSCYGCGSSNMDWTTVSGKGKLVAFTVIHIAPDEFAEEAPYYIAIIELTEGTRVSARLLGYDPLKPEDVKLGSNVKLEYETIESGKKYLAFRPV